MQIVIDIPTSTYEYLAKMSNYGKEPLGYFERVIMRGIPLPKGHGRLIDADVLDMQRLYREVDDGEHSWFELIHLDTEAPTVIEAEE